MLPAKLTPTQERVLEQFQRKFAKVGITSDPRLRQQFLWLWRRILRETKPKL